MDKLTFWIPDAQHQEWLIAGLLPHIWIQLMQHKVTTLLKVVEISMRLEATPGGVDNSEGMGQV